MICYCDDAAFAHRVFPDAGPWDRCSASEFPLPPGLHALASQVLKTQSPLRTDLKAPAGWLLFCTKHSPVSHFDGLIEFMEKGCDLPDRVACLAGAGANFHGQRGRPWVAAVGNIHLAVLFRPERRIPDFGVGFPLLAAVSVIETTDSLPGLEGSATFKWVNDVLLESAKVAGFVARAQSQEDMVRSAVLGVGLNVETVPRVAPDPFSPQVTSLKAHSPHPEACRMGPVLKRLLERLDANYRILCAGDNRTLLEFYRSRSAVIGREVRIVSDPLEGPQQELARGKVTAIGDHLELYLDNRSVPLSRGRLIQID